jgi:hypothetical protein
MKDQYRNQRLEKLHEQLFNLANEFALDGEGTVAVEIHNACNRLIEAKRIAENGASEDDDRRQITEWFMNQPGLMQLLSDNYVEPLMPWPRS